MVLENPKYKTPGNSSLPRRALPNPRDLRKAVMRVREHGSPGGRGREMLALCLHL